jgi:hypothetical protein
MLRIADDYAGFGPQGRTQSARWRAIDRDAFHGLREQRRTSVSDTR